MKDIDLAALLASRLCHDLISPVGALCNGLEVLAEDDDPEMRDHAMELIKSSAEQASAKLQYARLAFGAGGSAGAHIDLEDAKQVAETYVRHTKAEMRWDAPNCTLPKQEVKLLLNLVLLGLESVPRGGKLAVTVEMDPPQGAIAGATRRIAVTAEGPRARLMESLHQALTEEVADEILDSRAIQAAYTRLILGDLGYGLSVEPGEERVVFAAVPGSRPAGIVAA